MMATQDDNNDASLEDLKGEIQYKMRMAGHALHQHRRPVAGSHVFDAIQMARSAPQSSFRSEELIKIGSDSMQVGFADLGLMAWVASVSELEAGGNFSLAGKMMLEIANVFSRLNNLDEMSHWNERALRISLDHHHYANAAAASTNLAVFGFVNENFTRAHELASASLGYLEQEASPHTETVTRWVLTQISERLNRPAEETIAIGRPIFGRLRDVEVSEGLRRETEEALNNIAARYLAAHPELDGAAWKAAQIPELWGGGA